MKHTTTQADPTLLLTRDQCAYHLGIHVATFDKIRSVFPKPVNWPLKDPRWSREAVEEWIRKCHEQSN